MACPYGLKERGSDLLGSDIVRLSQAAMRHIVATPEHDLVVVGTPQKIALAQQLSFLGSSPHGPSHPLTDSFPGPLQARSVGNPKSNLVSVDWAFEDDDFQDPRQQALTHHIVEFLAAKVDFQACYFVGGGRSAHFLVLNLGFGTPQRCGVAPGTRITAELVHRSPID